MPELKLTQMSVNDPKCAQRSLNKPKGAGMGLRQLILA